jgi:ZIP family zinc transporter
MLATGEITAGMRYGLLGGAAGFAATALGALPALFLRAVPQRVEDAMLGFAAGMMLAASAFSLLLPGLEAAEGITGNGLAAAVVVAGMTLGVLLMLGLDQFTPTSTTRPAPAVPATRAAPGSGCSCSPSPCTTCRRAWPSGSASPRGT